MVGSVGGGIPNGIGLKVLARYAACGITGFIYGTVGCTRGLGTGGTLLGGMLDGALYDVVLGKLSDATTGLTFSTGCKLALICTTLPDVVSVPLIATLLIVACRETETTFDPAKIKTMHAACLKMIPK